MTRIGTTFAELPGHSPEQGEPGWDSRWTGLLWTPKQGFTWSSDLSPWPDDPTGPYLVATGDDRTHYEPLSGLRHHRIEDRFASLSALPADDLPQGIERFATEFGFLGVGQPLYTGEPLTTPEVRGEPLTAWQQELRQYADLRAAADLAAQAGRVSLASAAPLVEINAGGLTLRVGRGEPIVLAGALHHARSQAGALLDAVALGVSTKLSEATRVGVRVGKPLRYYPGSLLGVIYLAFALRLADHGRVGPMRRCAFCDGVIQAPARRDRRYCSPRCRKAAQRSGMSVKRTTGTGGASPATQPITSQSTGPRRRDGQ